VQHGSPQPIFARHVISKNLMARRSIKGQSKRASDEAVATTAPKKQAMASDDKGHSSLP
jgi:hypothetical protein